MYQICKHGKQDGEECKECLEILRKISEKEIDYYVQNIEDAHEKTKRSKLKFC